MTGCLEIGCKVYGLMTGAFAVGFDVGFGV